MCSDPDIYQSGVKLIQRYKRRILRESIVLKVLKRLKIYNKLVFQTISGVKKNMATDVLYKEIQGLLENRDLENLKKRLNETEIALLLELIQDLESKDRVIIFRLLNKDLALEVFESLTGELQESLIAFFAEDEVIELFSELEPDDRVRLMEELPARVTKKILNSLSKEEREKTSVLMGYPPETAGRIMSPEYVRLRQNEMVESALSKIRRIGEEKETLYTLYVTDDQRRFIGCVSLLTLTISKPEQKIKEIMNTEPVWVTTNTDQEEVARILQQRDLLAVPVVDGEKRLVGVVTVDDAMDVLETETTEDIFGKAGLDILWQEETVRSNTLVSGSLWKVWRVRLPFLLIVLVGGIIAGFVISGYEEVLAAVTSVAFFIPVIMDMGGNVGVQSATIFIRAMVLKQIKLRRFLKHLLKEIVIGFGIGTIVGVLAGGIAVLWQQSLALGLVVGLAVVLTTTLAASLGFIIPYVLFKTGLDMAAGSDPIITTLKDITGLLIYFFLVTQFLRFL
jgi:magnesium transporter